MAARSREFLIAAVTAFFVGGVGGHELPTDTFDRGPGYRLETIKGGRQALHQRFDDGQVRLLEKLNRADLAHLATLPSIVVPDAWMEDELAYSPMPLVYPLAESSPKLLIVAVTHQVFGAYEFGRLVRWGPVSSGRQSGQTPAGIFHLNWRTEGRYSTVDQIGRAHV